ncbi:HTH_Tnp_Tc3_2 domain-containing protein [Trichonephila clavipes]|nr:HTH_Tnp_Tc3_2 domain-containing protein [Trichonephila clavipes]
MVSNPGEEMDVFAHVVAQWSQTVCSNPMANWRIARHTGRSDAAIRRCSQEWVGSSRFQFHNSSGRLRATSDREDRLIVRSAVRTPDSSFSTIRRATRTRVSTMIIHRRLIERNLRSYRPLCHLPLTTAHY